MVESSRLLVVRILYNTFFTPILRIVFGLPTNGEPRSIVPQYSPKIEYLIFAISNAIVIPFITITTFNAIVPKKYSIKDYLLSYFLGIISTFIIITISRSVIINDIFALSMCCIGFGVYVAPLFIIGIYSSYEEMIERHLFLIPTFFTVFIFFISCCPCALDNPLPWKFFPTPSFILFPLATVISDLYSLLYVLLIHKDEKRNLIHEV
ncbi:hypothetical protein EDI_137780 [Entamoeba dispar SAW760]|uniref:Uncharacterized protein n=1 Tax=Entamoeba dispar (strain ATCC PRA-260 / SAW760) TaxID=370354 RepID=B0E5R4_ENTDS|nr:uncharacterized protein EDI_137780 [Entamoeba dispar SAW760]EDR30130.1 hypothetical protein EDI_137780 [Entamoeba dispar SAW760]|eukprot:EDR30130.1 hypothetical protein EDI_137780 [Entamoeba dispar SAW760]